MVKRGVNDGGIYKFSRFRRREVNYGQLTDLNLQSELYNKKFISSAEDLLKQLCKWTALYLRTSANCALSNS